MTMARIADAMGYSKGTIYQHFSCKEEIIIALACQSVDKQRLFVERAASFQGRPRERMAAIGIATELFSKLYSDDARIFQTINAEAITQKASKESLWRMRGLAHRAIDIMMGIVRDAIAQGDLVLGEGMRPEDVTFHLWMIGESGKMIASGWMTPDQFGIGGPFQSLLRTSQAFGDGLGWHPLSSEWSYDASALRILSEVFPKEAAKVFGPQSGWEASLSGRGVA